MLGPQWRAPNPQDMGNIALGPWFLLIGYDPPTPQRWARAGKMGGSITAMAPLKQQKSVFVGLSSVLSR